MFTFRLNDEAELRLLEERHAEELFALVNLNRAYLREWLPWVDGTRTAEDTRKFIRMSLEQFARNGGFSAGIYFYEKLVGVIGFHEFQWPNRTATLGYWLAHDAQGKGLMTLAAEALTAHAFEIGMNRVQILAASGNTRSRAIPERLKFTQEGILRQGECLYGRYVDQVVYAMLKSEWEARQNRKPG